MLHIGQSDLEACLDTVHAVGEASTSAEGFARGGVACLKRLVPSELTTLSICDLDTGHRSVVCDLPGAIGAREIEAFDRHLHTHPLVRAHCTLTDQRRSQMTRASRTVRSAVRPVRRASRSAS